MTKRIFRSICLAAVGVFLASAVLFLWVLYNYFSAVQWDRLRVETELAAHAVSREGIFNAGKSCLGRDVLSVNRGPELTALVLDALEGRHGERSIELKGRKYELLTSPVLSEDQVSGAVLLIIDMTERRQRETLRREFSVNVSHELKRPSTPSPGARSS